MKANRYGRFSTLSGVALFAGAFGCSAAVTTSDGDVQTQSANLYYIGPGAHWPRDPAHISGLGADIAVCYTTPGAVEGSPEQANRVAFVAKAKTWVENTWGRVADINFYGWGPCGDNTNGLLVLHINAGTGSGSQLGYQGPNGPTVSDLGYQDTRQPVAVVHELGHILGFEHEFMRSDWEYQDPGFGSDGLGAVCNTDADCAAVSNNYGPLCVSNSIDNINHCRNASTDGMKLSSSPDHDSVMAATYLANFTNSNTNGVGDPIHSLSADDVLGVQAIYGVKPPGSIVGLQGRCAAIAGGSLGADLLNWPCTGTSNMQYGTEDSASSFGDHLLKATITGADQCIDVQGGAVVSDNWTPLISSNCDENDAGQAMNLSGVKLRAMGNMCVSANFAGVGSHLQNHRCGDNAALENWDLVGTSLRLSGTNLCLSVPDGTLPLGTLPTLDDCNSGTFLQSFVLTDGEIHKADLCLAVMGGTTQDGLEIGLWNGCNGTLVDEAFSFTGAIHSLGQCMSIVGSDGSQGLQLSVYPCIGAANQEWDYHWE